MNYRAHIAGMLGAIAARRKATAQRRQEAVREQAAAAEQQRIEANFRRRERSWLQGYGPTLGSGPARSSPVSKALPAVTTPAPVSADQWEAVQEAERMRAEMREAQERACQARAEAFVTGHLHAHRLIDAQVPAARELAVVMMLDDLQRPLPDGAKRLTLLESYAQAQPSHTLLRELAPDLPSDVWKHRGRA